MLLSEIISFLNAWVSMISRSMYKKLMYASHTARNVVVTLRQCCDNIAATTFRAVWGIHDDVLLLFV